jgi:ABC-type nitrate/sulfonate/bicarbonate transport system substrate-binding protein
VRKHKKGYVRAGARRLILAGFAAAVVLGAIGYLLRFQPTLLSDAAQTPLFATVLLDAPFDPAFAGEMVAEKVGLFQREGLSIEFKSASTEADTIHRVSDDPDTIGVAKAESILLARAEGTPLVAFAGGYVESPIVLYTLEKSDVRTPNDFLGKRIGYRPGQDTAIIYQAMMAKLMLSRSAVREVKVGADMTPFLNGEVDVWPGHISAEGYTLKRNGIGYNLISPGNYGVHVPGTVYFTAERTVRNNPELIRRFLSGVIAGWQMTYADYATSVPLIASFDSGRLKPDYVRFGLEQQRASLRPLGARFGEFDQARWQSLQAILIQQRLLKGPLDLSKVITYDVLRAAYRKIEWSG